MHKIKKSGVLAFASEVGVYGLYLGRAPRQFVSG